jgi:hypothetical protein
MHTICRRARLAVDIKDVSGISLVGEKAAHSVEIASEVFYTRYI